MNEKQYGVIPLEDYIKIVEPRGKRRAKKLGLGVAALAMCLLCTAAGDYLQPWSGRDHAKLTFDRAIGVLQTHWEPNHLRTASVKLRRYCRDSIEALYQMKQRVPEVAATADAVLMQISRMAKEAANQ